MTKLQNLRELLMIFKNNPRPVQVMQFNSVVHDNIETLLELAEATKNYFEAETARQQIARHGAMHEALAKLNEEAE